jgi:hypothetical protein
MLTSSVLAEDARTETVVGGLIAAAPLTLWLAVLFSPAEAAATDPYVDTEFPIAPIGAVVIVLLAVTLPYFIGSRRRGRKRTDLFMKELDWEERLIKTLRGSPNQLHDPLVQFGREIADEVRDFRRQNPLIPPRVDPPWVIKVADLVWDRLPQLRSDFKSRAHLQRLVTSSCASLARDDPRFRYSRRLDDLSRVVAEFADESSDGHSASSIRSSRLLWLEELDRQRRETSALMSSSSPSTHLQGALAAAGAVAAALVPYGIGAWALGLMCDLSWC